MVISQLRMLGEENKVEKDLGDDLAVYGGGASLPFFCFYPNWPGGGKIMTTINSASLGFS